MNNSVKKQFKKAKVIAMAFLLVSLFAIHAAGQLPYKEDFEKIEIGKVPSEFIVLDGAFVVKEQNGNKFLELPGSPLDSYAVQFGPAETENVSVSASINGTAHGRRVPVFGVGLNGVAGYRLQLSPSKNALELYKDQSLKGSVAYDWKSGSWLNLKLQVRNLGQSKWRIEGKVWARGKPEPPE